ncbi:MAG: hypothetical protein SFV81_29080 [Pirellulaceae bacterium]|nr:hypothetical protein [Pirellulaceae bacterium]
MEKDNVSVKVYQASEEEVEAFRESLADALSGFGLTDLSVVWNHKSREIEIAFNVLSCHLNESLESIQHLLSARSLEPDIHPEFCDPELGTFRCHHEIYWRSSAVKIGLLKLELEVCGEPFEFPIAALDHLKVFLSKLPESQAGFLEDVIKEVYPQLSNETVQFNVGLVRDVTESDFKAGLVPIEIRAWDDGSIGLRYQSNAFSSNYIVSSMWEEGFGFTSSLQQAAYNVP